MELFKLLGTIAVNNEAAMAALDETTQKANDAGQQTQSAFGKIGTAALTIGKTIVTAGAALGGAWIAAIEGTREYRTHMGMLDTAFQTSGLSAKAAKQTYSDLNAVLGDSGQATEAAQHLALLADNEKELETWTTICTGVFARLGESVPLEELASSSSETARAGILTGGLVDALVQAGISEEEFQAKLDACTTEQKRQDLIMNTLNTTYAKAGEQYRTTNKDVLAANRAQEKLTAAFAELGRIGEPILTLIKTKVADMVTAAVPHLQNFVNKVKDLKKWIKENENTIDAWVAVIIGATVSIGAFLLVLKWSAIMAAATKAVKATRAAILLFNAALRANPIGLVVSLLAGLVAAFVYLWNNNKGFRDFWISMWAKVRSASGTAVDWIKNKFSALKSALGVVKTTFGNIQKTISDKLNSARDKVKSVIDKIKGYFSTTLKFKGLKMPSIKLTMTKGSGLMAKAADLLGLSGVPKFSVKWNAEGAILRRATIFGRDANGQLQGGGEAGAEAVAPIETLKSYIREAVRADDEAIVRTLIEQNRLLMDFLARIMPQHIALDTGALVGVLTPAIDMQLADRWNHAARGNTR